MNKELKELMEICDKNEATIMRYSIDGSEGITAVVESKIGGLSTFVYDEKDNKWH